MITIWVFCDHVIVIANVLFWLPISKENLVGKIANCHSKSPSSTNHCLHPLLCAPPLPRLTVLVPYSLTTRTLSLATHTPSPSWQQPSQAALPLGYASPAICTSSCSLFHVSAVIYLPAGLLLNHLELATSCWLLH